LKELRLAIIGFGNVGRELARALTRKADEIERGYGVRIAISLIASSKGCAFLGAGWREDALDYARRYEAGDTSFLRRSEDLWGAIDSAAPDLAFIAIPPSYDTGEPNLSIYRGLIERGMGLITADKTGLAMKYREIIDHARRKSIYIGYRATVMAGTPAIDVIRGVRGRDVRSIRGILNATSNYILSLVEGGLGYREAIKRAVEEKLAEPDPRIDVEGLDAAAKIVILANEAGIHASLGSVRRIPLSEVGEDAVRRARREGGAVKYIAYADLSRGEIRVSPEVLGPRDPLRDVSGSYNGLAIEIEGEMITLIGPAGPASRTANVMITDLTECIYKGAPNRP